MVNFLDCDSVSREDPQAVTLHEILIRAYDDEVDALALAGQVGILKADVDRYPRLRLTWWSILDEAAREGQLRNLVSMALRDPTIANWRPRIQEILGSEIDSQTNPPKPASSMSESERRDASMRPIVGNLASLWESGTNLSVRFLNGSVKQRETVEEAARQWVEYANINFEFNEDPDARIRVSFDRPGSWAYVAKTCLTVAHSEPTVNLEFVTDDTPREAAQSFALHEFGHVLGLQHEYGNPTSTIKWNRSKVYESLKKPPNSWSRAQIDRTIFAIWPPRYFPVNKVFDPNSIMMHELPAHFFISGQEIVRNQQLSPLDKQFVAALYPQRGGG